MCLFRRRSKSLGICPCGLTSGEEEEFVLLSIILWDRDMDLRLRGETERALDALLPVLFLLLSVWHLVRASALSRERFLPSKEESRGSTLRICST